MKLTRTYKNSGDATIRIDTIFMERHTDPIAEIQSAATFIRRLKVQNYTISDNEVDSIILEGDFSEAEGSSGNFLYVSWASPACVCQMYDLPGLGDLV